jgi:hypothetical protein
MNTAFLDALNLAWKIHHVEAGFADRSILQSYEPERKLVAENLLNFDAKYAKLFSTRPPAAKEIQAANVPGSEGKTACAEENDFIKTFKESCEFTSGYGVAYDPNDLNWSPSHPAKSPLIHPAGTKLRTGRIFMPANVTRVVDANVVHLEQEIPVNGSYRIFIFAGKPSLTYHSKTSVQILPRNIHFTALTNDLTSQQCRITSATTRTACSSQFARFLRIREVISRFREMYRAY